MLGVTEFVIIFDRFADESGLIEHFLPDLDIGDTGTEALVFGEWCTAGEQDKRDVVAVGVDDPHGGVGQADIDMDHDGLWFASYEIKTVGHGDGDTFMGDDDWLG